MNKFATKLFAFLLCLAAATTAMAEYKFSTITNETNGATAVSVLNPDGSPVITSNLLGKAVAPFISLSLYEKPAEWVVEPAEITWNEKVFTDLYLNFSQDGSQVQPLGRWNDRSYVLGDLQSVNPDTTIKHVYEWPKKWAEASSGVQATFYPAKQYYVLGDQAEKGLQPSGYYANVEDTLLYYKSEWEVEPDTLTYDGNEVTNVTLEIVEGYATPYGDPVSGEQPARWEIEPQSITFESGLTITNVYLVFSEGDTKVQPYGDMKEIEGAMILGDLQDIDLGSQESVVLTWPKVDESASSGVTATYYPAVGRVKLGEPKAVGPGVYHLEWAQDDKLSATITADLSQGYVLGLQDDKVIGAAEDIAGLAGLLEEKASINDLVALGGLEYELDEEGRTAKVRAFSRKIQEAESNFDAEGNVVIPPFVVVDGVEYAVTEIAQPLDITSDGSFASNSNLKSIVAPATVVSIGKNAFDSCVELEHASFPGVTNVEEFAFSNCPKLKDVSIAQARVIGRNAFYLCSSLKGMELPNATDIGGWVFDRCASLEYTSYGSELTAVPALGDGAYNNIGQECKIIVPDALYSEWTNAWSGVASQFDVLKYSEWENVRRYELDVYAKAIDLQDYAKKDEISQFVKTNHVGDVRITGKLTQGDGRVYAEGNYSHAEGGSLFVNGEWIETTAKGQWSHAEGAGTLAKAQFSHAEGRQTESAGDYSHAEGYLAKANCTGSHAEGSETETTGIGQYAHAEGHKTVASNFYAHAEGGGTRAEGANSHSEGVNTLAQGNAAHAEGYATEGYGGYAHVEGYESRTRGNYSHAEGYRSETGGVVTNSVNGESVVTTNYHHFAFAWQGHDGQVDTNGVPLQNPFYRSHGVGTFNVNPVGGLEGFYVGEQSLQEVFESNLDGKFNSDGVAQEFSERGYSVGEVCAYNGVMYECIAGYDEYPGNTPDLDAQHWEVLRVVEYSPSKTYYSPVFYSEDTTASTTGAASGSMYIVFKPSVFGIGDGGFIERLRIRTRNRGMALPTVDIHVELCDETGTELARSGENKMDTYSTYVDFAFSTHAPLKADGSYRLYFRDSAGTTITDVGLQLFTNNAVDGYYIVSGTTARYNWRPIMEVYGKNALKVEKADRILTENAESWKIVSKWEEEDEDDESGSVSCKEEWTIAGEYPALSVTKYTYEEEGNPIYAPTPEGDGEEYYSIGVTESTGKVTIGVNSTLMRLVYDSSTKTYSVDPTFDLKGASVTVEKVETANYAGEVVYTAANGSVSIGGGNQALGENSLVVGTGCISGAKGYRLHQIDGPNKRITILSSDNDGLEMQYEQNDILTLACGDVTYPNCSKVAGSAKGSIVSTIDVDALPAVFTNGVTTAESSWYMFVAAKPEVGAVWCGMASSANGINAKALGEASHSEGIGTTAIGRGAHAEGKNTQAKGDEAHAEGNLTQAVGVGSHAEGNSTFALGDGSHAEGNTTYAIGEESHSEGYMTYASDYGAHAEGVFTSAAGYYSHADGYRAVTAESGSLSDTTNAHSIAYAWQGWNGEERDYYHSHGNGTFNINPVAIDGEDETSGFYIGDSSLKDILSDKADKFIYPTNTLWKLYKDGELAATYLPVASKTNEWETATNMWGDVTIPWKVLFNGGFWDASPFSPFSGEYGLEEIDYGNGWKFSRRKLFLVPQEENTVVYKPEMADEMEAIRNEVAEKVAGLDAEIAKKADKEIVVTNDFLVCEWSGENLYPAQPGYGGMAQSYTNAHMYSSQAVYMRFNKSAQDPSIGTCTLCTGRQSDFNLMEYIYNTSSSMITEEEFLHGTRFDFVDDFAAPTTNLVVYRSIVTNSVVYTEMLDLIKSEIGVSTETGDGHLVYSTELAEKLTTIGSVINVEQPKSLSGVFTTLANLKSALTGEAVDTGDTGDIQADYLGDKIESPDMTKTYAQEIIEISAAEALTNNLVTAVVDCANLAYNTITQDDETGFEFRMPPSVTGHARKFYITLTCGSSTPSVVFKDNDGSAATILYKDSNPRLTVPVEGINLYTVREIDVGQFLVERMSCGGVAQ